MVPSEKDPGVLALQRVQLNHDATRPTVRWFVTARETTQRKET